MKNNLLNSIKLSSILAILILFFKDNRTQFISVLSSFLLELFLFKLFSSGNGLSNFLLSLLGFFVIFFRQFIRLFLLNTLSQFLFLVILYWGFLGYEFPALMVFLNWLHWLACWLFAQELIFILIIEDILLFFVSIRTLFPPTRKQLTNPWLRLARLDWGKLSLRFFTKTQKTSTCRLLFWGIRQ
jgi:hypothetical protein